MKTEAAVLPSFDNVANLFVSLGALASPAELHGMTCGRLCGGGRYSDREWLQDAFEFLDVSSQPGSSAAELMVQLYHATLEQLHDEQLGMQLLLPGDDVDMTERVTALSHWCQGFLTGFGTSGITADTELSSDTADALRDFASFVQMSPDTEDDAESENDYMELVEYIRLAALSIFLETGAGVDDQPADDEPTIH